MIYAQTMIHADSDGNNALGDNLAAYRTAITTAQAARSAWCSLIAGTDIIATGDLLADGIDPNAAGHAAYLAFVKTTLGL